jgi:hypothetical protein
VKKRSYSGQQQKAILPGTEHPIGGVFDKGAKKIAAYLDELTAKNYPYDIVQWRYNIVSDNGPIDTTISDFVDQWNKKYASPKLY